MRGTYMVLLIVLNLSILLVNGCSHQLEVKNVDEYYTSMHYTPDIIKVGVRPSSGTPADERFIESIVMEMRNNPNITVDYPFTGGINQVDYLLSFHLEVEYRGSAANFFTTWPGFVIFAPAWNGFTYYADISTSVEKVTRTNSSNMTTKTYDLTYKAKHSSIDRTWVGGVGWFDSAFTIIGVTPFIGGFYNTTYDSDITPSFNRMVLLPYSTYISRSILKSL